jgi:hypothetical protein
MVFFSCLLSGQPDIKDSTAFQKLQELQGLTGKVKRPAEDFPLDLQEKFVKTEARPSNAEVKKAIPLWLWIVIGFVPGLLAGGLFIFQYSRSKIYSLLAFEKNKYLDRLKMDNDQDPLLRGLFRYVGIVALLKRSKDEKKRAAGNLAKEIEQLKKLNESLKYENEAKENIITELKISADNKTRSDEHYGRQSGKLSGAPGNNQNLFFTIPEIDGCFKSSGAKDWQDIDCFYKIVPDENGQKGRLYFISGEYDLRALDNIDYYLNPVCEIQNITDRSFARKIVMTDPGCVVKVGEHWKIEDNCKVKIKLV